MIQNPDIQPADVQRILDAAYAAWLHVPAKICDARLQRLAKTVASTTTNLGPIGTHVAGPLKAPARIAAKLSDYIQQTKKLWPGLGPGAAAGGVLDVSRCTVEVSSPMHCRAAYEAFSAMTLAKEGLEVVRSKNMFFLNGDIPYRDVKLTVLLKPEDGADSQGLLHFAEIQLILKSMLEAKHYLHVLYEVERGDLDSY